MTTPTLAPFIGAMATMLKALEPVEAELGPQPEIRAFAAAADDLAALFGQLMTRDRNLAEIRKRGGGEIVDLLQWMRAKAAA